MRIIRVFPRRTSYTPIDSLAFVGDPQMMRPEADEVHISCAFTWDKAEAERLAKAWGQYYPVVKIGGPAFDTPVNGFQPGFYVKDGVTFTTHGCNDKCPPCLAWRREGPLSLIPDFAAGYIIQDNNLLQAPHSHVERVFSMLRTQKAAIFSGGIAAPLVTDWFADLCRGIKINQLFLACDTDSALQPLRKATRLLSFLSRNKLRCYVLIGRNETIGQAGDRLKAVWEVGCMPFAQLYQPPDRWIDYSRDWRSLARNWSRPAIMKSLLNA